MTNNKSFTLIELLVVIAIIGVLSAIIITSISGAVTKSRIVRLQVFSDSIRAQLSDSLVSYWSFNEGTGVTAYDQWEGNNGTLGGGTPDYYPTWRSGGECVSGKCLEFDGSNDYVNCGNNESLDISTNTTWSWWMKWNGNAGNYKGIISRGTVSNTYTIRINGQDGTNNLQFRYYGVQTLNSGITPSQDWEYWTILKTDRNFRFYKNGVYITEDNAGQEIVNSGNLLIGYYEGYEYFSGLIDEVRIYNSAASITQIQSQYLAGLDKLLSNGAISKSEYNQRIKELSKEIVIE